ncbi:APC family permease, partial [Olsenella sp. HMSC062G07]|uniref:APC family permease n=1 Tax=Olsenella sp. HMSC062G07 TaxID=1739330 RepID=UPI0011D060DB
PQQAEEASEGLDWKKFGIIPALALLAAGGFYVICIYAFGSIIDWHEFVVPAVPALAVLERINVFFYVAMLIIATLGPLGPMNAFFGASSRLMLALGRKRMLPEAFAEIDSATGAPKTANIVLAGLTLVGPFLGRNMLVPLTNVASLGFIFACTMAAFACLRLRKTEPELPRPYKVNGGIAGICAAILAGLIIIGLMVLPFSPAALNSIEWTITVAWVAVGFLIFFAFGGARELVQVQDQTLAEAED